MKRPGLLFGMLLLALAASGCATTYDYHEPTYTLKVEPWTVLKQLSLDPALEDSILALNPERISDREVREILSRGPVPRVLNIHGGIYPVYLVMESFSEFLIGMGYPEQKIRNPGDGTVSHSPYENSEKLAGLVAWYYEKEGMMPILVGHSQGGMQVVKVLHEFAAGYTDRIRVWNPLTKRAEERTFIVDPLTGRERPVIGLQVGYATGVGAGGLGRLRPNQWSMFGRLTSVPDTVREFTAYSLGLDFFAADYLVAVRQYQPNGKAHVRNVRLPVTYQHVTVPVTAHLVKDQKIKDWINTYTPSDEPVLTEEFESSSTNILWAADVWHGIKKYWCLEAQELIRAKRALAGGR
jgi:hypothetical protein